MSNRAPKSFLLAWEFIGARYQPPESRLATPHNCKKVQNALCDFQERQRPKRAA
jgi:hypothetical protein